MASDLPRLVPLPDGGASTHGTAVSWLGFGILIAGASGSGKTTLAVKMMDRGGWLISDDLSVIRPGADGPVMMAPQGVRVGLELRGLGLVYPSALASAPLDVVLVLEPSAARLPEAESIMVTGRSVPVLRHPAGPDLIAKLRLFLTEGGLQSRIGQRSAHALKNATPRP